MKRLTSWLFWANFVLFQWFFIRLARQVVMPDGRNQVTVGWNFIGPVIPLTGWWNRYWRLW